MNKKVLYTLITIVAFFALGQIHGNSFNSTHFSQNTQYTFNKHQNTCSVNTFDFISESEDDFRDSKFQNHIQKAVDVSDFNFTSYTQHQKLFFYTSRVSNNAIYQGVPYFISLGNMRI